MNAAQALADTGIHLEVVCGSAGCALVSVRGELDTFSGAELAARLGELIASGRTTLTLDLSELVFIDTAGHRSLRSVADLAESLGGEVLLGACSRPVRRFLDLTASLLASTAPAQIPSPSGPGPASWRPLRAVGF